MKESFHKLVKVCAGPDILSKERVRMFSRRAQAYMVACYLLEKDGKATIPGNVDHLKKKRKAHTDVVGISFGWILEVMKGIVISMKKNKKK